METTRRRHKKRKKSFGRLFLLLLLLFGIIYGAKTITENEDIMKYIGEATAYDVELIHETALLAAENGKSEFSMTFETKAIDEEALSTCLGRLLSERYSLSHISSFSWSSRNFFNRTVIDFSIHYDGEKQDLSQIPEYSFAALEEAIYNSFLSGEEEAVYVFRRNSRIESEEQLTDDFIRALKNSPEYNFRCDHCSHIDRLYLDYAVIRVTYSLTEGLPNIGDVFEATDAEQLWHYAREAFETGLETVIIRSEEKMLPQDQLDSIFISAYYNDAEDIAVLSNNIGHSIYVNDSGRYIAAYKLDFTGAEDYEEYCLATEEKLDSIVITGKTPAEKYRAIFDYILENCVYDDQLRDDILSENIGYEVLHYRGAYGALVRGETICSGYASAFKALCDRYSLPCLVVTGVVEDVAHVWNAVLVDGKLYYVDATFADTSRTPERYYMMTEAQYRNTGYIPDDWQYVPQLFREAGLTVS
ncbi:MAG: hypothetical protein J6D00_06170 [Christensenellaceae bacterium]|nr:hypothetical protein [Christensenellaceae bacterium]